MERRYPDLIWSAETFDGGRVLFLIEFQRTAERLMALRTTTYTALEGIVTAEEFSAADPLPEFVYLVLGLAGNLSARDMAARMSALRMAVERYGEADLDAFLFERMYTMLELRGYTEGLTQLREKTMAELVDRFQRSLDELVQEGRRQGIQQGARQGRHEGQVLLLRRQIARKFGDDTAGQLSELLDDLTGIDNIDRVTDALLECGTGEEFIERMQMA